MNVRLARFCLLLWLVGFLAMAIVRGVLGEGPGSLAFGVSAWLWAMGGATYCLLGGLACFCDDETV